MDIRKSARQRKQVDYALANKVGFHSTRENMAKSEINTGDRVTEVKEMGDSPLGNPEDSQVNVQDVVQRPLGTIELIDEPITGDLLDDKYWLKIKEEHDSQCLGKEQQMLLTERQIYIANKRKTWLDNNRKLELLKLQVEQLDDQEVLATARHKELIMLHKKRNAKVEDWFNNDRNKHKKTTEF